MTSTPVNVPEMTSAERRDAFFTSGAALGFDADELVRMFDTPVVAATADPPRLGLLSDAEWQIIRPLLPQNVLAASGASPRQMLDVALWRVRHRHGGWRSLPTDLAPSPDLARQKWSRWVSGGVLAALMAALPGLPLSETRRQEFEAVGDVIARTEPRAAA